MANEDILRNVWNALSANDLTDNNYDTWKGNVFQNSDMQQNVYKYLASAGYTDSSYKKWHSNAFGGIIAEQEALAKKAEEEKKAKAKTEEVEAKKDDEKKEDTKEKELDVKEHVDALVAGNTDLSEEFKTKAATIFETAIKSKVKEIAEEMEAD